MIISGAADSARRVPSDRGVVILDGYIALVLLIQGPGREVTPAFRIAEACHLTIREWGVLFLIVTVLAAIAVVRKPRTDDLSHNLAFWSRTLGSALYAAWAVTGLVGAIVHPAGSFLGFGIYFYLAYRHQYCPLPGK